MRRLWTLPTRALVFAMLLPTALLAAGSANAAVAPAHAGAAAAFSTRVFASGAHVMHVTPTGREAISEPDDITALGHDIFAGFQNGVGPQG